MRCAAMHPGRAGFTFWFREFLCQHHAAIGFSFPLNVVHDCVAAPGVEGYQIVGAFAGIADAVCKARFPRAAFGGVHEPRAQA